MPHSLILSQHVATGEKRRAGDPIFRLDGPLERCPWIHTVQTPKDVLPIRFVGE